MSAASGIIPYLCVPDAKAAIDFWRVGFGAEARDVWTGPDGKIGFADVRVGAARWFVSDPYPEIGVGPPAGAAVVSLVLPVEDPAALFEAAVAAGATVERPMAAQDDGARRGTLRDPSGHRWIVSTPG